MTDLSLACGSPHHPPSHDQRPMTPLEDQAYGTTWQHLHRELSHQPPRAYAPYYSLDGFLGGLSVSPDHRQSNWEPGESAFPKKLAYPLFPVIAAHVRGPFTFSFSFRVMDSMCRMLATVGRHFFLPYQPRPSTAATALGTIPNDKSCPFY